MKEIEGCPESLLKLNEISPMGEIDFTKYQSAHIIIISALMISF